MLLDSTTRLPEKPRPPKAVVAARKREIAHRYAHQDRRPRDRNRMLAGVRRREIEALIKHEYGRLPDTDDRELILSIWAAHNITACDQAADLDAFALRLHVKLPPKLIEHVVADVERKPRRYRAATLGRLLKLTNETREFLAITTIAPCDITPEKRRSLKRAAERERKRLKRRAAGMKPRIQYEARRLATSLKVAKPWVAEGISRGTWFHAYQVLDAWELHETPTILTWGKDRFGTGDWLRGQTEHCIMAARGEPVVTLSNQSTLLLAPVRGHSEKPVAFYDLVESLCPAPRYADLFSRYRHDEKWDCHGDQARAYDAADDIRESVAEGFRAIRARVAAGRPEWPSDSNNKNGATPSKGNSTDNFLITTNINGAGRRPTTEDGSDAVPAPTS